MNKNRSCDMKKEDIINNKMKTTAKTKRTQKHSIPSKIKKY